MSTFSESFFGPYSPVFSVTERAKLLLNFNQGNNQALQDKAREIRNGVIAACGVKYQAEQIIKEACRKVVDLNEATMPALACFNSACRFAREVQNRNLEIWVNRNQQALQGIQTNAINFKMAYECYEQANDGHSCALALNSICESLNNIATFCREYDTLIRE